MKTITTISDIGSVKVGNDNLSLLIPNGYGDGDTRIEIYFKGDKPPNLNGYFTTLDGEITIHYSDCGYDPIEKIRGKFEVYVPQDVSQEFVNYGLVVFIEV